MKKALPIALLIGAEIALYGLDAWMGTPMEQTNWNEPPRPSMSVNVAKMKTRASGKGGEEMLVG